MGLLVFSPVVLLAIPGYRAISSLPDSRIRDLLSFYGPVCLLSIFVYSLFSIWVGAAYGPRYLTGILPILSLYCGIFLNRHYDGTPGGPGPVQERRDRRKTAITVGILILIVLSVVIHAVGVFYYPFLQDIGMDEKRVWNYSDLTILRSLRDGGERLGSLRILSYPPLPPILSLAWRSTQTVSIVNESVWQTGNLTLLNGNPV
jgi:hypothetical protein